MHYYNIIYMHTILQQSKTYFTTPQSYFSFVPNKPIFLYITNILLYSLINWVEKKIYITVVIYIYLKIYITYLLTLLFKLSQLPNIKILYINDYFIRFIHSCGLIDFSKLRFLPIFSNYVDLKEIDLIINTSNKTNRGQLRLAENCYTINLFNSFYTNNLLTTNIFYIIKNLKYL